MGYFKDVADSLLTAAKGMRVTFTHLGEKANTVQWPHEPATTKARTRSELFNNVDDCIACSRCAQSCPVDCITIESVKATKDVDLGRTSNGKKKVQYLSRFDIDMAKCCYCGLCTDACPTDCLIMTEKFDYSQARVEDLMYRFARMSEDDIALAKRKLEEEKKAVAAERAAKAAAAKAAQAEAEQAKASAGADASAAADGASASSDAASGAASTGDDAGGGNGGAAGASADAGEQEPERAG